jgi:GTP cyclohydrolase I
MRVSDKIHQRIKEAGAPYAASDNISKYINFEEMRELEDELTNKFMSVLDSLIIDLKDPNSEETPRRLAKMYLYEIMSGRYEPAPKVTAFPNEGNKKYNGMIVVRAELKSLCAHHHQTISGTAYIGIIPNGKVMGLSKYIRLAQWCARRGTLQEELCNDIADAITNATASEHVGVYIAAEHGCCTNRGVNAHSALTQTTVVRGLFDTDAATKKEFFDNIQLQEMHSKTR